SAVRCATGATSLLAEASVTSERYRPEGPAPTTGAWRKIMLGDPWVSCDLEPRNHTAPWHGTERGPGRPFGPDPSRRRPARSSVVYWVSRPLPGPTPHPAGVPRLDRTPALRLAEQTESCSVMTQNPTLSEDGQPAVPCWTVQQTTDLSSDVNR